MPTTHRPLVVTGPTASGKTELALRLARELGGEIISCDSRQMYKDLAAGTDKPLGAWSPPSLGPGAQTYSVEGVPYHLVDFLEVTQTFSAGEFVRYARPLMDAIRARGRLPILAGGTGLYLRALLDGLDPMPPADEKVRAKLRAEAESRGRAALHERLRAIDPEAAKSIPPNNLQRVMRALEVYILTGKPISSLWTKKKSSAPGVSASTSLSTGASTSPAVSAVEPLSTGGIEALVVGLRWDPASLEARVRRRCAAVFPAMISEVRALLDRGVAADAPGLLSLGYPEAVSCLRGKEEADAALGRYQRAVLQYAKRQRTWFRKEQVRWIDVESEGAWNPDAVAARVTQWYRESSMTPVLGRAIT